MIRVTWEMAMVDMWDSIVAPVAGRNVRRASNDHPIDLRVGLGANGERYFIVGPLVQASHDLPRLTGFVLEFEHQPDDRWLLVIELRDNDDRSVFRSLIHDLMLSTEHLSEGQNDQAVSIIVGRIQKWQEMLRRRRESVLSRSEILGLFGELAFLVDNLPLSIGIADAVKSWRGGYGDEQDFAIGNVIIETKSQLSTSDAALKISSENQLDTQSGEILIRHATFSAGVAGLPGSRTLNEIANEAKALARSSSDQSLEDLEDGLIAWGYSERDEYDEESWTPIRARNYEVADNFPAITSQTVAPGITRVRYQIAISACSEFERSEEWLTGKLKHAN